MTDTVETLIQNASTNVASRIITAYDKANAALGAYDAGETKLEYGIDITPAEAPSFVEALGVVARVTEPTEGGEGGGDDGPDLAADARGAVAAIQEDYVGIATAMLEDIVGAFDVDISPLLQAISVSFEPSFSGELGRGASINKRARIGVMDAAAQRGFTYMPGQVVADIVAAQLNEYGVSEARSVVGTINAAKIAAFSEHIGALSDALSAMVTGKARVLNAAASYATAIARATEVAIDETFAIPQAEHAYKKLESRIKIKQAAERDDLISALTAASSADASFGVSLRKLELAAARAGVDFVEADYAQYSSAQKTTVEVGVAAVEWLGRLAAAAEAAANVVVSASVTAFD